MLIKAITVVLNFAVVVCGCSIALADDSYRLLSSGIHTSSVAKCLLADNRLCGETGWVQDEVVRQRSVRMAQSVSPASSPTAPSQQAQRPSGATDADGEIPFPSQNECRRLGQAACEEQRVRAQQRAFRPPTVSRIEAPNAGPSGNEATVVLPDPSSARPDLAEQDRPSPQDSRENRPVPRNGAGTAGGERLRPDDGTSGEQPQVQSRSENQTGPLIRPQSERGAVGSKTDSTSEAGLAYWVASAAIGSAICILLVLRRSTRRTSDRAYSQRSGPPLLDADRHHPREQEAIVAILESETGAAYPIKLALTRIGRSTQNDLVVSDPAVSRVHAVLRRGPSGQYSIENHSDNGTLVNNRSVTVSDLIEGDLIKIGSVTLRFMPV